MATRPGYDSAQLAIELDGKVAGPVQSLQMPAYRLEPVVAPIGPDRRPALGNNTRIEPMQAEFEPLQAPALLDWALSLPEHRPTEFAGAALVLDHSGKLQRRVEWREGLLTELRLPILDAASKQGFGIGISWQPGSVVYAKPDGSPRLPAAARGKGPTLANFRVLGLPFDASFITRVGLPTVSSRSVDERHRFYERIDLGELTLEFSARSRDAVLAWAQKIIDDGRILEEEYLDIVIDLLDTAMKKVLLSLRLSGCGLLAYEEARLESMADQATTVTLRLSISELQLKLGG
ncbi:hypothetical protein OOZ63_15200 [Paucibacter sp. PLA-PC-4]|uniref:hypothetical protein n=1 Tax=Paucibacter sp. PLA-PC-4 TaxID=2993655 RepID=UPI002249557C|nr:hypothetical protein [Paucibacter sp. PLA-PC-4]MCX2863177.1 hypothetical protein [Paucibacter sp. PLA-PC-4]